MRIVGLLLVAFGLLGEVAGAQQQAPSLPHPVYGTVMGRITCVDTNLPARLASVTLQTINVKPMPSIAPGTMLVLEKMTRTYQTGLDGSFLIPKVTPGTYYVVIQSPGYVSPISQFTRAELQQPTPEMLTRIVKAVPTVTVEADHTTNLDTRIERGAELSGTIRYDDGSPVSGNPVNILTKETKDGKDVWTSNRHYDSTDDLGHYRITGLPAGDYLLQVGLNLMDSYGSDVLSGSGSMMMMMRYDLSFFSGDVARKHKGKPVKLTSGEQRAGADITIPVSKLHRVAGTLTEQRSGHVINGGDLALKYTDGTELVKTKVDPDDNTFHFDYVPEGEYTLAVTQARDVVREEEKSTPGAMPMPGQMHETFVRGYSDATQPLIVQNDVTGWWCP